MDRVQGRSSAVKRDQREERRQWLLAAELVAGWSALGVCQHARKRKCAGLCLGERVPSDSAGGSAWGGSRCDRHTPWTARTTFRMADRFDTYWILLVDWAAFL